MIFGIILVGSLLLNLALVAGRGRAVSERLTVTPRADKDGLAQETIEEGDSSRLIAMIPVRGLISSGVAGRFGTSMVDDLKIQLKEAENDPQVKAVVLAIDSPGGEVTASDIIYNAVCRVRAKKPVIISMGSVAASGGYYIACGGSHILANETTFTGSIGVIIQSYKYYDLLGKLGVAPLVFKSGAFKDMLSGSREMTQPEKDYIQALVMQTYGKFVGIVARERNLPEQDLHNGIADGRIVSGKDALEAKLVDGLGEIEDAYKKARELGAAKGASVIAYKEQFKINRFLRAFGADSTADGVFGKSHNVEIKLGQPLVTALEPGKAYFVSELYVP